MTDYLRRESLDLEAPGVAGLFDELSVWSAHFGDLLLRHYPLDRDLSILDLACGNGFPLIELAHVLGPSCRIVGADVWRAGLSRAAAKRRLHGLDRVALVRGDGAGLPFRDAMFDRVVSNLGVNNFADPGRVLAECRRVLRPGGLVTLTTNVTGHMRELYAIFEDVLRSLPGSGSMEKLGIQERHRLSRESIAARLENAGFLVRRVVEEDFTMRLLDGSALLRHSLTRVGFLDGWRSVVEPSREEEVFQALESRLNAAAAAAGELRLTVPMLYIEARR